jgi:hypothetical protein
VTDLQAQLQQLKQQHDLMAASVQASQLDSSGALAELQQRLLAMSAELQAADQQLLELLATKASETQLQLQQLLSEAQLHIHQQEQAAQATA